MDDGIAHFVEDGGVWLLRYWGRAVLVEVEGIVQILLILQNCVHLIIFSLLLVWETAL